MKSIARILSSLLLVTMIASLLPGCSKSPATSTPGASALGANPPVSTIQVTPGSGTKVTPQLDNQDLVDALIPTKGGQVNLTLPSGLAYSLNIPNGALLNDQEITLVPLTRVDGMLLSGGLIGGVELQPEGLELLRPATLTITVPKGYDAKQMVGIGYHGKGEGFHLDVATGDGKTITLSIDSFSGHGAASGTNKDIDNQAAQPTTSPADSTSQQMADAVKQCVGQDDATCLPLIQLIIAMYKNPIEPNLQAAQTDDTKIDSAGAAFLKWWHDVEMVSLDREITINGKLYNLPGFYKSGLQLMFKGLRNAFDQASKRCLSQEDISQATKMIKRLRELALLSDDTQPPYTLETKWKDFEACSRFRLTFESNLTWTLGESMKITADLKGSAIFRLDGEGEYQIYSTRNGSGKLNYDSFDFKFTGVSEQLNNYCTVDTSSSSGVLSGALKLVAINQDTGKAIVNPTAVLKPSDLDQTIPKFVCKTGATGANIDVSSMLPQLPLWETGFRELHKNLLLGDEENRGYTVPDPFWFTQDFTPGDGVYHIGTLQLHSTGAVSGANVEEDLTIEIVAAPGATE